MKNYFRSTGGVNSLSRLDEIEPVSADLSLENYPSFLDDEHLSRCHTYVYHNEENENLASQFYERPESLEGVSLHLDITGAGGRVPNKIYSNASEKRKKRPRKKRVEVSAEKLVRSLSESLWSLLGELEVSGKRLGRRLVRLAWSFESAREETAAQSEKKIASELNREGEGVLLFPDWSKSGRRHGYGLILSDRSDRELKTICSRATGGHCDLKEVKSSIGIWSKENKTLVENLDRVARYSVKFLSLQEVGKNQVSQVVSTGALQEVWRKALTFAAPKRVCAHCGASLLGRRQDALTCSVACRKAFERKKRREST